MTTHVHRPASLVPIAFGVLLLLAIGAPGAVLGGTLESFLGLAVCAVLAFGLSLFWFARVECTREGELLRLHQVRWPLPSRDTMYPLKEIQRVDVRRTRNGRYLVLVLGGDREIRFPGGGSSSSAHDETAAVLREWIGG